MKVSRWKHYFNFAHHLEIGNRNKRGSIWDYCQGRIGNISRLAFDLLLLLFWSASQLISLTFRRHQRTCYSLYPLLKHIEPLFVRKVKKIPLWATRWSQSFLTILSSAHLFVTIRRSNTLHSKRFWRRRLVLCTRSLCTSNPVFVGTRSRRRPTKKRKLKNGFPISASKSFYLGCERGGELAAGFTGFSLHFFLVIFFVGSIS